MPPFVRTVRFKLTIWYSSLLLVFGVAFVVALNLAARLDRTDPNSAFFGLRNAPIEAGDLGPGQALRVRRLYTLQDAEDEIYDRNLDNLRTWSLVAVVGLAVTSGVGGYVLSGMMLRPVRDITQVASEISATNLSRRINHQGPDDELRALANTFDSMIARIEDSFEQQRQFVQNASHELRTPLAAIRTNIEVTEMDPEVSTEDYRSLLETVKTQTARLTRLSEDLLILTTAGEGAPELDAVSLGLVVREVLVQLAPIAAARGTVITVEGDETIEAQASGDGLYRSLMNLVENAIKYAGDGARVRVMMRRVANDVELSVQDNGAGISPDELPHLFDRFYRIDKGRSRREGGTGLGLAIVKELVTGMAGTVSVESRPGSGSAFTIRLPAAPPEPPAAPRGLQAPLPTA